MAAGCNMEEGGVDEYDIMYRVTDTWNHVARRLLIQTW